jgi:CRP-like cAMP-binding protein
MPNSNKTVEAARKMLEDRRAELHAELQNIEEAIAALGGKVAATVGSATGRLRTGRRRGPVRTAPAAAAPAAPASPTPAPRRRRRRGGTRSEQALKLISEKPGLTASQIATQLGIKPNYMYRVLGELESEGKVRKDGRKYLPPA